jgi:aminopeptidase
VVGDEKQRWRRLAELAVHGANVQPGQTVSVSSEHDQAPLARAVAEAAYDAGARFVDVWYYDARVKEARLRHADAGTLDFVPPWYGARLLQLGDTGSARISLAGLSTPKLFEGLDPALVGRDRLPWLKEVSKIIADRSTNWCIVPCPHVEWSRLVFPELSDDDGYERLWQELEHVLRLDEPDPKLAWDERMAVLRDSAATLTGSRFDAIELRGPGTELTIGLLPSGTWLAADFETRDGVRHIANLPTEEVFTSPDPERTEGHVRSTKPLVLRDGTIIRGLRVRFEGGRAVEVDADENAAALRAALDADANALRLGELALVDDVGRIGPLGTIFYDTLLDENAASHIAFGSGFPFAIGEEADRARVNDSGTHIDFMIGSPELEVDGITREGERVPVLRNGAWQPELHRRANVDG